MNERLKIWATLADVAGIWDLMRKIMTSPLDAAPSFVCVNACVVW